MYGSIYQKDKYKYHLLEVIGDLHGFCTGSFQYYDDELLNDHIEWLRWRVTFGWCTGSEDHMIRSTETHIHKLACQVLNVVEHKRKDNPKAGDGT